MINRQVMLNEMEKPERNLWVLGNSITDFLQDKINKVYDEIESKTCKTCKYASRIGDEHVKCHQGIIDVNCDGYVPITFSCAYYHRF